MAKKKPAKPEGKKLVNFTVRCPNCSYGWEELWKLNEDNFGINIEENRYYLKCPCCCYTQLLFED